MAPKLTRSQRTHQQKKKTQQLKRRFDQMNVDDDSNSSSSSDDTTDSEPEEVDVLKTPETNILMSRFPLYDTWEKLEGDEVSRAEETQKKKLASDYPQPLPVLIHCAAPTARRFTREVESTMQECNNIEAIKDIVKSSLVFELVRAGIDPLTVRFAGLMTYGPTTEFSPKTIYSFTRGLFVQEAAFKQWWLSVNQTQRAPGDMVKIGVVLWDQQEAIDHRAKLPDFWTEPNARLLANQLENIEMPVWDLDVERGCRTLARMQEQVLDERIKAAEAMRGARRGETEELVAEKGRLTERVEEVEARYDALVAALEARDEQEVARLVAAGKTAGSARGKGKGKGKAREVVVAEEEEEEEEEEEDEEMGEGEDGEDEYEDDDESFDNEEGDDSSDEDYVE